MLFIDSIIARVDNNFICFDNYIMARISRRKTPDQSGQSGQSGMSLIEIMIGVGIMAVAGAGFMQLMNVQNKSIKNSRSAMNRDQIQNMVARFAGNCAAIDASAPAGSSLKKCLTIDSPDNCSSVDTDFDLKDPVTLQAVAGTAVYYNANTGAVCTTGADCALAATAKFRPLCPNGAATCDKASTIVVSYSIGQKAGATLNPPLVTKSGSLTIAVPCELSAQGTVGTISKFGPTDRQLSDSLMTEDVGNSTITLNGKIVVTDTATINKIVVTDTASTVGNKKICLEGGVNCPAPPATGQCAAGQVLLGFNTDGTRICSTTKIYKVQATTCPSQTYSCNVPAGNFGGPYTPCYYPVTPCYYSGAPSRPGVDAFVSSPTGTTTATCTTATICGNPVSCTFTCTVNNEAFQ